MELFYLGRSGTLWHTGLCSNGVELSEHNRSMRVMFTDSPPTKSSWAAPDETKKSEC